MVFGKVIRIFCIFLRKSILKLLFLIQGKKKRIFSISDRVFLNIYSDLVNPKKKACNKTKKNKKTLVIDLDETLVHSTTINNLSFHHDLSVDVTIENFSTRFFVTKRPYVDTFIRKASKWFDIVIFTSSLQQYADPVIDSLDSKGVIKKRLFRESCVDENGQFVKDLTKLGFDLSSTVLLDNSPFAYKNNPENALPISNWYGYNPDDESLINIANFLQLLRHTKDVRSILGLRLLYDS